MQRAISYSLFVALGTAAFAQTLVSASSSLNASGQAAYDATFSFRQEPFMDPVVTGSPYSANEMVDTIRFGSDGKREEVSALVRRLSRDAEGRVRIERQLLMGPLVSNGPAIVEIIDPAASIRYVLDPDKKIAHRWPLLLPGDKRLAVARVNVQTATAVAGQASPAAKTPSKPQSQIVEERPEPAVATLSTAPPVGPPAESLGSRVIEGIEAQGARYTYQQAVSGDANSRAVTTEMWVSWKLQLTLLARLSAANGGETTTSLRNVKLGTPAADLFQIPADYKLQEEPGTFQIQFLVPPPAAN